MRGSPFASDYIEGKAYDGRLVRRLLTYVRPQAKLILIAMLFMIISAGFSLLIPYLSKLGIDRYLATLYHVYEARADISDSLLTSPTSTTAFLRLDDSSILVRKTAIETMNSAIRSRFLHLGELQPETYYLFPAQQNTGETGFVRGDYWLVPEAELGRVPPRIIVEIRGANLAGMTRLALLAGLIILLGFGTGYGHVLALQIAGQRSMYQLRMALFGHIQGLSLTFFDKNPVGRLVTRVTNDIEALNEMFAAVLVNLVKDVLLLLGTAAILFALNPRLALISMAVLPLVAVVSFVFRRLARGAYREVRRLLALLNATLSEDLSGIKVIQMFRREPSRREHYESINVDYFKAHIHQLIIFGVFRPIIELLASTGVALVLVYGGIAVLRGSLTLGALVAFISYVRQMFRPVKDMSEKYNIMQSAMASAERIFGIMDQEPDIAEIPAPIAPPLIKGRVVFENVCFSYAPETKVLRDVSFIVESGKSIALVGPTGAGKTSIISLLCRFYDPTSGHITLDGVDLKNLPMSLLREHVAVVLQDAFIFGRSVEENIRLGKPLGREDVRRAADIVQALGFIDKLPGAFDEVMAERGATLSTGQRQLICFARALAHDPEVLILDEATSSVDPTTERLIQHAIETLMQGRTSIIVAHRLSTIRKADEILVIDDGRIMERGNHQELLTRRGIYYNLYLLQYARGGDLESDNLESGERGLGGKGKCWIVGLGD